MTINKKDAVKYDARSFIVNGKREILIGGEFHYFRTPNELWEDRIIKMKRSGSNLVATYIPWNYHEQFEGQERWSGDQDLVSFINLCQKYGMFMIVKPGPYCCAELDFGGHPDWLLGKKIPLRVLNDKYLAYVEKWYKKVAEVINPYLATNGGNIVSIQVENEYDHLLEYGEEKISLQDAITYFNRLKKMMEDNKIDIPKFANEAGFLRGKGIIDTRTYYPNIPFFTGWEWQFEHYDDKIMSAKNGQPDCPTMIMELQKGWFGMHGHPFYFPSILHTQGISKSTLICGASVLNFYMFVGGTTFPFWGSRGDAYATDRWGTRLYLNPMGTGLTTSFDFGGSLVREWGELLDEAYDWMRAFNLFVKNYFNLVVDSDNVDDIEVLAGGEDIEIIRDGKSDIDIKLKSETEKFRIITKKLNNQYITCIRNLSNVVRTVDIGFGETGKIIFKNLIVNPHETLLLPINVDIPNTNIKIIQSTSELLFSKKMDDYTIFAIYGKEANQGETVLNGKASDVKVLSGKINVKDNKDSITLTYKHIGLQIVKIGQNLLLILEEKLAGKVEELNDGILIGDTYYIKDIIEQGAALNIKIQMLNNSTNKFYCFGNRNLSAALIDGKQIKLEKDTNLKQACFEFNNPKTDAVRIDWTSNWKIKTDNAQLQPSYNDNSWRVLDKPISLEEIGMFEHGYVWYRSEFEIVKDSEEVSIIYYGNNVDRQYIYINGNLVWRGITERAEIEIDKVIRPGKNQITILYENFFHNKSHPHEGELLKYSGILKSPVIEGKIKGNAFKNEIPEFKVRMHLDGVSNNYADANFDDSKWQEVESKPKYVFDEKLGLFLWMRRKFKINAKAEWKYAVKLTIPNALHRCFMYVNGKAIGWFENIGPQYDFYVPECYLQENNALTILMEGPKGFLMDPKLTTFYEAKEIDIKIS